MPIVILFEEKYCRKWFLTCMIKLGWYREQINQGHQHHTTFREKKISAEVKTRQINTSCICGVQSFNERATMSMYSLVTLKIFFFIIIFLFLQTSMSLMIIRHLFS